jgi:hypothetical protein
VKPLQISEPASQELAEAVRWHEERRPGWGERLFDEVSRRSASSKPTLRSARPAAVACHLDNSRSGASRT